MDEPTKGIFCCVGKDGKAIDEGIIDEMLENDDEITRQLIKAEIIKDMTVTAEEARGE